MKHINLKSILFICALVCSAAMSAKTIYFAAGDWDQADAKFAVYHWETGKDGVFLEDFMTKDDVSGYYTAKIPDASTYIILVRMTTEATAPGWNPKFNQTEDLTPGNNNLFTFTSWDGGKGGNSTGTWSTYGSSSCTPPTIAWETEPANGTIGGTMTATVTTNQSSPTITWTSSDANAATVSDAGLITYKAAGTTTITAQYTGDGTTYCAQKVSVSKKITVEAAAGKYYFMGRGIDGAAWGNGKQLTIGIPDMYEYIEVPANSSVEFKITEAKDAYTNQLNYNHVAKDGSVFKGDVAASSSGDDPNQLNINIVGQSTKYYIIVYYPTTDCNTSKQGIICVSTTLPTSCPSEVTTYTVTFDANGRDNAGNMPKAQKIKEGKSAVQPTGTPTATGYTFDGWYTEKECTTAYEFTTPVTADITLYAKWTEKPKYTVTISAGANGSVDPKGEQQIGEIPVTITATPHSGYQLDKWETSSSVVVKEQAGASITVTATATGSVTATFTEATPKLNIGAKSDGSVCGKGENWTIQPFTKVPNETGIYSTKITLKAGTFSFSIIETDGKFYKNGGTMMIGNCSSWPFGTDGEDPKIATNVTGEYEFRWDNTNKTLSVIYPIPDNFYYYDDKGNWGGTDDATAQQLTKTETYAYLELDKTYLKNKDNNASNEFKIFDDNKKAHDNWYGTTEHILEKQHTIACGSHIDNNLGNIPLTAQTGMHTNAKYENPELSIEGDKFYVLLFYPNTPVNSTRAYKLAASTTLPGTGGDYSVTILTNNASYGTVSPAGIQGIKKEETLTITATPKKGYMLDTTTPWSATKGITVTPTEGNPNEATVSATQSGTVTANFVADPNFADNPCVALHGNFTGEWKSTLMEISPDGQTATYTLNITGTGNKNFGIKVLNECSTDFSDKNKKAWMWGDKSNHNISRTTRTLTLIEQSGDNGADISMLVDIAGEYTFTYEYANQTLTVTYPSKEIKPQQYLLYGNFEGAEWGQKRGTWNDGNQVGTWTLNLKKGAYMFKLLSVTAGSPSLNAQKGIATIQRENPDVMVDGEYSSNDRENITLNADEDGKYTVIFTYTTKKVHVTYPGGSKTKYRLVYAEKSDKKYEKYHPSTPYIDALAEGATEVRRDIVSLHVRCSIPDYDRNSLEQIEKIAGYKKNNNSLFVYLQRWNSEQWETIQTLNDLATNASIAGKNGVYNFVVVQDPNAEEETRKVYIDEKIEAYKGNYYIRTNVAPGGWNDYKQTANQITYSDYAAQHKHFDHYWCKWVAVTGENAEPSAVEGKVNLKFTIANDYSNCVSDTCLDEMDNRQFTENGRLGSNANVRWMWHSKTNDIDRAYIAGGNECLFFVPKEGNITCKDKESPFAFDDRENWTYKIDVTTPPNTKFAITKKPHGDAGDTRYYILGSETEGVPLITGQTSTEEGKTYSYSMRVVYDFKSDHLIYAWVPGDNTEIKSNWELGTSIVCMRIGHNRATQIAISPKSTQLNKVTSALGVLSLTKKDFYDDYTSGKMWEREYYWISFPFDVCISDIFSTFVLGRHYRIQDYDGASRAKNGCWIDSPSYWRTLSKSDTLKAGMGYLLNIRHSKVAEDKLYDNNPTELNIYFPSAGDKVMEITGTFPTITVPEHECKIERENRYIYDSNWNLIGVPTWVNITGIGNGTVPTDPGNTVLNIDGDTKIGFYYHFNTGANNGNTWTPRNVKENESDNLVFQNMHSYLVQWAGTIDWSDPSFDEPSTQGLQARRAAEAKSEEYTLRLELSRGETALDQTFVRLQEDGDVTADYDMNYDMTKIINPGANLYSLIGTNLIQAGANVLPLPAENTTVYVPMGVVADKDGMYRFSMPDGTEGMLVSLADHETGMTYSLATGDYEVSLTKGTYEQRFVLEIQPKKNVTTGCNESTTDDGTLRKVLIDGNLYIQRGDALYDAAGRAL